MSPIQSMPISALAEMSSDRSFTLGCLIGNTLDRDWHGAAEPYLQRPRFGGNFNPDFQFACPEHERPSRCCYNPGRVLVLRVG